MIMHVFLFSERFLIPIVRSVDTARYHGSQNRPQQSDAVFTVSAEYIIIIIVYLGCEFLFVHTLDHTSSGLGLSGDAVIISSPSLPDHQERFTLQSGIPVIHKGGWAT